MLVVLTVVALVAPGFSEDWNQFPAPNAPSERFGSGVVTLDDGRVVLFGGCDARGELINDLHVSRAPQQFASTEQANPPPGRFGATLTQISETEVLLFGGQGEEGVLNEVWILDLASGEWRRVAPERAPPPRKFHCAWYDERTGRVYIAGGIGQDGRPRRDLWAYEVESNLWVLGPEAPEEFWGAYVTVYCESPCVAVILGPVSLAYDMVRETWRPWPPREACPRPNSSPPSPERTTWSICSVASITGRQGTFSRLPAPSPMTSPLTAGRTTTPCPRPTRRPACGGRAPSTMWWQTRSTSCGACRVGRLLAWRSFSSAGWPIGTPPSGTGTETCTCIGQEGPAPRQGASPELGGQPGRPGQPGPGAPPPKERPDEPEAKNPWLEACLIAERLDDSGQPVNLNPTFTGSHDQGYFGFRLSPLCEPLEFRIEVYDASGTRRHTASGTTVDPGEYGVDCLGTYTNWQPFPLGPTDSRPLGSWWVELYLEDQLVCVSPFQVDQ